MSNIFLSVPIADKPEYRMIYTTYKAILSAQHPVRIHYNENDSLISRIRNTHISAFYYDFPECDYFCSIDSDLELLNSSPENNIFNKLIEHDVDFCGGLYCVKKPGPTQCSSISATGKVPDFDSGLTEMLWLSSGCWCIKRSAVKKMIEAYPELEYDGDDNAVGKKVHGLYIPMLHDMKQEDIPGTPMDLPFKKYLSEDWAFCQRWKAIGGKIFADSSLVLRHIGKISYSLYHVHQTPEGGLIEQSKMPKMSKTYKTPPAGFDLNE